MLCCRFLGESTSGLLLVYFLCALVGLLSRHACPCCHPRLTLMHTCPYRHHARPSGTSLCFLASATLPVTWAGESLTTTGSHWTCFACHRWMSLPKGRIGNLSLTLVICPTRGAMGTPVSRTGTCRFNSTSRRTRPCSCLHWGLIRKIMFI